MLLLPSPHGHPWGAVDPDVAAEWAFAVAALGYFSMTVLIHDIPGKMEGLEMKDSAAPQELPLATNLTGVAPLLDSAAKQPTKA